MAHSLSRRDALVGALSVAATAALPHLSVAKARRILRVAHMTDFHIQPEGGAPKGMAMALQHAMKQKPDVILTGGDLIMDSFAATESRTKEQWDLYVKLIRDHTQGPVLHCLGNHDVWGWNKKASNTTGSEAKWGKRWFQDLFGYERTYYAQDFSSWRIVVLDNILETPDGYNGVVDPEQMDWLEEELGKSKKPTLLLSHIPILSITPVVNGYNSDTGEWNVGGNLMTKNSNALRAMFRRHPHVKAALSGHMHMVDRVDYDGVAYLCGGAVSGAWWNGPNSGFEPGYRLIDLHDDGTVEAKYVAWGWTKALMS
jgi:3',5'-cyclic AMP phosphodiesterase CpdA